MLALSSPTVLAARSVFIECSLDTRLWVEQGRQDDSKVQNDVISLAWRQVLPGSTVDINSRKRRGKPPVYREGLACFLFLSFGEKKSNYIYIMLQAILFYTPRWLWKNWEGGKIHALMMDLDVGICSEIEKKQKKKLLLDYLWDNLKFHNWWAYRYYFCELLALANVIGQMFLMNRFFDGAFLTFGIDVISFVESDQEDRVDPMIYIFPRMTKCTFYKYGVSGEVERLDAVCILPLNVVNEKIYIFLWFWFLILFVLTSGCILYRIIIILSPRMRVYLLRLRFRLIRRDAIDVIVCKSKMGDWFLIYMLGENVDSLIFRDVMHELAARLGHRHHLHIHPTSGLGGGKEIQEA
uniref:Innexin n=1 Tax=Timema bartmani TaxID=61472 RepID=A0A7R9EUJ3_9NEOP|nr:unnamed protein product [Timema bartmani]